MQVEGTTRVPFRGQLQVQVATRASDQPGYESEVPATPSLGLLNVPECLTEFGRPVYSAGDPFITKRKEEEAMA